MHVGIPGGHKLIQWPWALTTSTKGVNWPMRTGRTRVAHASLTRRARIVHVLSTTSTRSTRRARAVDTVDTIDAIDAIIRLNQIKSD